MVDIRRIEVSDHDPGVPRALFALGVLVRSTR